MQMSGVFSPKALMGLKKIKIMTLNQKNNKSIQMSSSMRAIIKNSLS